MRGIVAHKLVKVLANCQIMLSLFPLAEMESDKVLRARRKGACKKRDGAFRRSERDARVAH